MRFKYLHPVGSGTFWLDHRLTPEVSAMFCAMASRAPVGGIQARYAQVVEAVAESIWDGPVSDLVGSGSKHTRGESWKDALANTTSIRDEGVRELRQQSINDVLRIAEDRLCEYPLHPRVQRFFDDFVGKYGHSSIMELVGRPAVYSEGISWFTAWLLFDSPICAGQEFSTRAVQHRDWPMARECETTHGIIRFGFAATETTPATPPVSADLADLHNDWFEVFEAEVACWKEHLSTEANRLALGIGDKEPFRPALDRARWALPGTIATGCAHTTSLRERARVLKEGSLLAQASRCASAKAVWDELTEAYRQAVPGLAGMGLREAVYTPESAIPGHLASVFSNAPDGPDVHIEEAHTGGLVDVQPFRRRSDRAYLDAAANSTFRVGVTFRCSLAVARDWHRHRTLFPWHLQVVRGADGLLQIDHHYAPMSEVAKAKLPDLLRRSTEVFDAFMREGNVVQAALALPLGTRVRLRGQGGLRDVLYMLELRKNAHGANFEYKEQATTGLDLLRERMGRYMLDSIDASVSDAYGIEP